MSSTALRGTEHLSTRPLCSWIGSKVQVLECLYASNQVLEPGMHRVEYKYSTNKTTIYINLGPHIYFFFCPYGFGRFFHPYGQIRFPSHIRASSFCTFQRGHIWPIFGQYFNIRYWVFSNMFLIKFAFFWVRLFSARNGLFFGSYGPTTWALGLHIRQSVHL